MERGRRGGADGARPTPAPNPCCLPRNVDLAEGGVGAAGAGQILHVGEGDVERRVESVARQVARVEDAAVVEVDLVEREGAAGRLEVPAPGVALDQDLVGAVGRVVGVEVGGGGVERPPLSIAMVVVAPLE